MTPTEATTSDLCLVAGSTGLLGSEICRLRSVQGSAVRALVRTSSNPDKVARLKDLGAEIFHGDLKDPGPLKAACSRASTVISTASSTVTRQQGDSIESVDLQGQLNLVEAAEQSGVKHFILVSFPTIELDFPLQSAKRAVEERLRSSRLSYTILQPACFMEVWLGPALGFDVAGGTARIYGDGQKKTSWISFQDVARFVVAAVGNPQARNKVIKLGGPDALSPLEVVRLAEQIAGKTLHVEFVPEEALRAQYAAATDSLEKTFAALMRYYARGDAVDMSPALAILPVKQRKFVREYLLGR